MNNLILNSEDHSASLSFEDHQALEQYNDRSGQWPSHTEPFAWLPLDLDFPEDKTDSRTLTNTDAMITFSIKDHEPSALACLFNEERAIWPLIEEKKQESVDLVTTKVDNHTTLGSDNSQILNRTDPTNKNRNINTMDS